MSLWDRFRKKPKPRMTVTPEPVQIQKPLEKILLVDDDPDIISWLRAVLAEFGELLVAYDGNTAVRIYDKHRPEAVILDIILPQKSGFLVCEEIFHGIDRDQRPYVVMMTGTQGPRHRQYAEALGVNDYLVKPFPAERLTGLIKNHFGIEDTKSPGSQ